MLEKLLNLPTKIARTVDRVNTETIFEKPWKKYYEGLRNKFAELQTTQPPAIYWGELLREVKGSIQVRREERTILLRGEIHNILADRQQKGLDILDQTEPVIVFSNSSTR